MARVRHELGGSLELLHVTASPSLTIDLSAFPALMDLSADWRQVQDTIDCAVDLRRLSLGGYSESDLRPLASLVQLQRLMLTDRPRLRSLYPISAFPELRELAVPQAKDLVDVSALRESRSIEELDMEGCRKVASVADLAGLPLRRLNLGECGDISTLGPLRTSTQLEVLHLYGTTNIVDGDLTPIAELPRLRELRMQSRRHYKPSVAAIQANIPRS